MKNRLIALVLSLCLISTFLPVTAFAANSVPFKDVESGSWYYDSVAYVYEKGLMSGTSSSTFQPDAMLTRAQICQILYNMEGTPQTASNNFTDVGSSAWYYRAVNWAADHSIVSGVGGGRFQPDVSITREQMMTIMYRYAGYKDYDVSDIVDLSDYSDADAISDWAETAMKWAISEGFITGMTATTIAPTGTATRSQVAAILMRFCTKIEALQTFQEKDIEDFEGYTVINYDNSDETNFAVLTDGVIVIDSKQNENQIVSIDDENGVYVFKNANEDLTCLQIGDIFYYVYGQGINEFILIKVGTVEISGGTVTLTAGESEMHDFFEYIDIDMDIDVAQYTDTPNTISRNFATSYTVQPVAKSVSVEDPYSIQPLASFKEKFKISVDKEFSSGNKLSLALEDAVTITIKMKYDFQLWGKDYFEIKATIKEDLDAQISYTAQATGKTDTYRGIIASLLVPIGSSGFWIDGDLYYVVDVDASADIALKSSLSYTVGFQYDTEKGYRKINECESDDDVDAVGKISLTFGIGTDIGVDFMKLAKASIDGTAGLEIAGKTVDTGISKDRSENHLCQICVDGDISFFVEAGFKVKFGVTEKWSITPVNASVKWNHPLIDFYISFMNGDTDIDFGRGDCPHKKHLVTVRVHDSNGQPVGTAKVEILGSDELIADAGDVNADGIFETYCDNGSYKVYVFGGGDYGKSQEQFNISGEAVQIDLFISEPAGSDTKPDDSEPTDPDEKPDKNDTVVASGTCGWNLTWTLNAGGTLTIQGTGSMYDYSSNPKLSPNAPWQDYEEEIFTVKIDDGVTSIGAGAFKYCTNLTSVTIPNSVTSIGRNAFWNCIRLTSVTIPNSVTSIEVSAFDNCIRLTSVTIPNGVTSIEDNAFDNCIRLTSVTIPTSVTSIGERAFGYCDSLTNVYYTGSESQWKQIKIDNSQFELNDTIYYGNEWLLNATIHYNS